VVDGAADEEVGAAGNVTEANDDEAEVAVGLAKAELEAAAAWEELGRNAVADAPADEDVVDEVVPAIAEKGSTTGGGKTRPLRPPELQECFHLVW
jgi:predicted S18 family serine protease